MRTNIVLNDDLVKEALRYSRAKTKTALVEEALRMLVELRSKEERKHACEQRLRGVQSAVSAKRFRTRATELLREERART